MDAAPYSIDELLRRMAEREASDLHLTAGSEPVVRVRGQLERLQGLEKLTPEVVRDLVYRILTIEDPIEFLHWHRSCIVNQREVGPDTPSFADALRAALRQDPDVVLVGEMRDLETISTALTAAETGHLVFATLHTQSAPQTIDRIIDVFPAEQQDQVRMPP